MSIPTITELWPQAEALGITINRWATLAGVQPGTVYRAVAGRSRPDTCTLLALERALDGAAPVRRGRKPRAAVVALRARVEAGESICAADARALGVAPRATTGVAQTAAIGLFGRWEKAAPTGKRGRPGSVFIPAKT